MKSEGTFKPTLAATVEDIRDLKFPLFGSPKIDGIRAIVRDGVVLSRTLKPIPQPAVQKIFRHLHGLDGELVFGSWTSPICYLNSVSYMMKQDYIDPKGSLHFHVFDDWASGLIGNNFETRYRGLKSMRDISMVTQTRIANLEELGEYEENCIREGFEGVMLRSFEAPYKCGRSTLKQAYLLKLKRFSDGEAYILGYEPLMKNENEAEIDALGYTKRSSKKEFQVPQETLGALVVEDLVTGIQFKVGSGFTQATRDDIWANRGAFYKKIIKYKHMPYGAKEKPRMPIFLGFRESWDL